MPLWTRWVRAHLERDANVDRLGQRAVGVAYGLNAQPRSVSDRSDDASGVQLKVLYAIPRGPLSATGYLSGGLDVQFVRLPRTDATYKAYGASARDSLERHLVALD